jgi:hypothetical protein
MKMNLLVLKVQRDELTIEQYMGLLQERVQVRGVLPLATDEARCLIA